MRPAAAIAATLALAGCAGLLGPSPENVRAALDGFRTRQAEIQKVMPVWPGSELASARLQDVGDCGAMGAYFICDGTFVLADGSTREVDLWLHHVEGHWRLTDIVPKDTPST